MADQLSVRITAEDAGLNEGLNNAKNGVRNASADISAEMNKMVSSAMKLTASYIGLNEILSQVKSSFSMSGTFENMNIGIASLVAVNSQNTTELGRNISATEKFNMAQKSASEAVQLLRKANLETIATLPQLTAGFQSALGPSMKLGMTMQETIRYTTLMTQAAGAMGMPMDQLAQEMRSILSAQIDNNSVVAKNIGLTNDQIKVHIKQGDIYPFLISKLSDFESAGKELAGSWEGITSNLNDAWIGFKTNLIQSSGTFDSVKESLKGVTAIIQNQHGELDKLARYLKDAALAAGILFGAKMSITVLSAIKTAVGELTLAQYAFNVAARANPYIIAATVIAAGVAYMYDAVQKATNELKAANGEIVKIQQSSTAFMGTAEGKAIKLGQSYNALENSLKALQKARDGAVGGQAESLDKAIQNTKKQMLEIQKAAKDLSSIGAADGLVTKGLEETEEEKRDRLKKEEEERKSRERVADEIRRINSQTTLLTLDGFDREEEKARQTYQKQLETVGKTAAGRIAAENLLSAQLAEIQSKRDELVGSNLMAHAEKEKQIRISQIESAKQISLMGLQADIDAFNLKKQYSNVSKTEELEELRKFKEREYQIELKSTMDRIALMKIGSVELAKANADIIAIQVKHGSDVKRIDDEIALNTKRAWADVSDNIQNTFGSAIGNLINFTTSFRDAFFGVIQSMLGAFTQFIGRSVVAWAAGEDTKTAATISGNIMRVASNAWASATSLANTIATAIKEIAVYAWKAAAAAYSSVAAIPFVGPFMAPAVAAGALVAVTSMVGNIASAEGGYDIPSGVNPLVQTHEQEMILPKAQANVIRDMANNGGANSGTVINISAVDAKGVHSLFMNHGDSLVKALKSQSRNFNV